MDARFSTVAAVQAHLPALYQGVVVLARQQSHASHEPMVRLMLLAAAVLDCRQCQ